MRYLETTFALCVLLPQIHAAGKHDDSLYGKKGRTLLVVESRGRKGRLWNQGRYHGGLTLMRTALGSGGAVMILNGGNAYVYPPIESPSAENENEAHSTKQRKRRMNGYSANSTRNLT